MPNKPSQLQFKRNSKGQKCLVYTEDTVTKANDGGLKNMKSDRKIVGVYPSSNVSCCPVRLVEKYLSLCPNYYTKDNFYLQSLQKPTHNRWYASQVVGQNTLGKVIKQMLFNARTDGYFTGHSLRRSGMSRLFQAGVDRKLLKEMSGHKSDAVECYAITSDKQREKLCNIIAQKPQKSHSSSKEIDKNSENVAEKNGNVGLVEAKSNISLSQVTFKSHEEAKSKELPLHDIGTLITKIVEATGKLGKTTIKFEIEISNE